MTEGIFDPLIFDPNFMFDWTVAADDLGPPTVLRTTSTVFNVTTDA